MYKLGSLVLNGTDNLIISALIGVAAVGLSSNYLLVIAALGTIAGQVVGAFTASIGNLNAVADAERQERVFDCLFFICAWIYGYISVGLYMFLNPFINIWLGHDYLLSNGSFLRWCCIFTLIVCSLLPTTGLQWVYLDKADWLLFSQRYSTSYCLLV